MRTDVKTSDPLSGPEWKIQTPKPSGLDPNRGAGFFVKLHRLKDVNPIVSNTALSNDMRIFHFAMDRMNNIGHVHLGKGDLEAALPDVPKRSLQRAVKILKDANCLAPSSDLLLMVVPADVASHDLKKGQKCPHGCHGQFWSKGEWWDPKVMNRSGLQDAEWAATVRKRSAPNVAHQNAVTWEN